MLLMSHRKKQTGRCPLSKCAPRASGAGFLLVEALIGIVVLAVFDAFFS